MLHNAELTTARSSIHCVVDWSTLLLYLVDGSQPVMARSLPWTIMPWWERRGWVLSVKVPGAAGSSPPHRRQLQKSDIKFVSRLCSAVPIELRPDG